MRATARRSSRVSAKGCSSECRKGPRRGLALLLATAGRRGVEEEEEEEAIYFYSKQQQQQYVCLVYCIPLLDGNIRTVYVLI